MKFTMNTAMLMMGLKKVESRAMIAIRMYAQTSVKKLESDAKANARWTDRTGDARKRLIGYLTETPTAVRLNLSHGVDYGIWLELANEKRFAIVEPTIRMTSPYILRDFQGLLNRLGGV